MKKRDPDEVLEKILYWILKILLIPVIFGLFIYLVHPLLTHFIIPPICVHRRVTQYTSGQYKNYEDGEVFADFTESSGLVEQGEIIAFYHVNHWLQDNPIHGKHCDFFALDLQLSQEDYDAAKASRYEKHGTPYKERDYDLWKWSNGDEENAFFVGFCDESNTVKLALVTEVNARDFNGTGFYLHSEIDWINPVR